MSEAPLAKGSPQILEPVVERDGAGGIIIDLRHPAASSRRVLPLVDLVADYQRHSADIDEAIAAVLGRGDFVLGGVIAQFEAEFAEYCGTRYAIGVDSGFSAIELILRSFGVGPGDEVITAANTFYSTVRPIEACGARPVLVDVDPSHYTLDPEKVANAITPWTRAILPVHLYGHSVDMDPILELARSHELYVFEDACQAHGGRYKGRRIGSLGDAAAFSFYPSKNLGAVGDAGMIVTNNPEVEATLRRSRNLGTGMKYHHDAGGFNRRLDTIQAAVLRVKLAHLDDANERRREIAAAYTDALCSIGIGLPVTATWSEHVHHLYVVQSDDRDELARVLDQNGIQTGVHYPVPIHLQPAFQSLGYSQGDFPVTEAAADRILSLPMHPYLCEGDIGFIVDAVVSMVEQADDQR